MCAVLCRFDVAKDRVNANTKIVTECFTGSDMFLSTKVLCDRECMYDQTYNARASGWDYEESIRKCNGPWYCAKSTICEMYKEPELTEGKATRSCAQVRSCANHSQCFPNEAQARDLSIMYDSGDLDDFKFTELIEGKKSRGFTIKYGGFTVKTTCCANKDKYRVDVDIPCNSATGRGALLAAPLALLAWAAAAFWRLRDI